MTFSLDMFPVNVLVMFAVFCRIGALFMTAPAFGDFSLIPRIRLVAALAVTLALAPTAASHYPDFIRVENAQHGERIGVAVMTGLIFGEILIGGFLGLMARIFMSALNVAGQIIAFQIGLSLAQIFDPTQELQGAIIGGFLAVFGTTMIFVTDLHHLLLTGVGESYLLFQPGVLPAFSDMAEALTGSLAQSFSLGFRLSAPFILFGLVFYIGAGVLNRLMPQAQVFFMLLPANLGLGLVLLMLTVGAMMSVFLANFEQFLIFPSQ